MGVTEILIASLCCLAPIGIIGLIVWFLTEIYGPPIIGTVRTRSGSAHDFIDSAMFLSIDDD